MLNTSLRANTPKSASRIGGCWLAHRLADEHKTPCKLASRSRLENGWGAALAAPGREDAQADRRAHRRGGSRQGRPANNRSRRGVNRAAEAARPGRRPDDAHARGTPDRKRRHSVAARTPRGAAARQPEEPEDRSLAERLESLRQTYIETAEESVAFLKKLLEIARELVQADREQVAEEGAAASPTARRHWSSSRDQGRHARSAVRSCGRNSSGERRNLLDGTRF